jgi:hypothetical protein
MYTDNPEDDPLEGKGEEMIPEGGLPFEDIEDESSEPEEEPAPEEDAPDSVPEAEETSEESATPPEIPDEQPVKEEKAMDDDMKLSEDERDDGMMTIAEDTPPEEDHGMTAGYPPVTDENLPTDPGEAKAELQKPDEKDIKGAPLFSVDALDTALEVKTEAPQQKQPHQADPEMVKLLITDVELTELWDRADQAQIDVDEDIHNLEIGRQMLNQIQYGRNELLAGRDHYEEAERHINEVSLRIRLARLVRQYTKYWGWWLFAYQLIWITLLLGFLIGGFGKYAFASAEEIQIVTAIPTLTSTPTPIATPEPSSSGVENNTEGQGGNKNAIIQQTSTPTEEKSSLGQRAEKLGPDMVYLLVTMIWAGFGGAVGAISSLVQHIAQDQDFDIQHGMWYLGSSPMGIAVGAATFLLVRTGLLSLMESPADIQSPIIIYFLGFLVGYRHNVFTELVQRVLNAFRVEEPGEETPAPEPKPETEIPAPPPQPPGEEESPPDKPGEKQ